MFSALGWQKCESLLVLVLNVLTLQLTSAESYDYEPGSCFLQIDLSVFPFLYWSSRQMSLFAEAAGLCMPCFRQF
jgi:hypothetical protein